jgi:hypothetical protein
MGNLFYVTLQELLDTSAGNGVLPADPFRTMVTSLQCMEFGHNEELHDSNENNNIGTDRGEKAALFSPNSQSYLGLIALGDSGTYSLNHIHKLISSNAIERVVNLMGALHGALGSLQSEVKTRGIECNFMDVPLVNSCMSEKYSQPTYYRQDIIVEGVVTNSSNAPFDDCINLYVRRILEEAFQAEQSEDIVSSEITVLMGRRLDKKQKIDVRHISSRRQQVISILKAATVGEGEVYMDILIKLRRSLEYYDDHGQEGRGATDEVSIDDSLGLMKIKRRYHFSYQDDKGFHRCFAKYPFDSLTRGIYLSDRDILLYKNMYRSHVGKIRRVFDPDAEEAPLGPEEPLFLGEVSLLVKESKAHIKAGEYVYAAEWLMVLCSFIADNDSTLLKVSRLMSGDIGRVHSARNALDVIIEVGDVLERRIRECLASVAEVDAAAAPAAMNNIKNAKGGQPQGKMGPGPARGASTEIISLTNHFKALSLAHIEFKKIILSLMSGVKYSEFQSIRAGLTHEMWELFDVETRRVPKINPLEISRDRKGMIAMVRMIRSTYGHLQRIRAFLHMMEATIGANVMKFLVDLSEVHSKIEARKLYLWTQFPTHIRDLLGYIESFDKQTVMNVPSSTRTVSWFLNSESQRTVTAFGLRVPVKWDDIVAYIEFSGLEANFLRAATTVRRPRGGHFAELSYEAMVLDERNRHESPKFMVEEAAKVRYLIETHALRALHEAAYRSFTRRTDAPLSINANMSIYMSSFNDYLHKSHGLNKNNLIQRLYTTARVKDAMHLVPGAHGACKIKVINRYINAPKAQYTSGGVFGTNRMLTVLGYNAQNVFTHVWMIPPLFPAAPNTSTGIAMSINVGISGRSALHWGMPKRKFHEAPVEDNGSGDKAASAANKNKKGQKMDSFYTQLGAYTPYHFPEPFEIEVAIKYSYELSSSEMRCRKSFGFELSRCTAHLGMTAEWKLHTVTIPHAKGANTGSGGSSNRGADDEEDDKGAADETIYTARELEERGADLNMQGMAAKHCVASIGCSVLYPDHASGREEELLDMVSKLVSSPKEVTEDEPDYDRTSTDSDRVFADDKSAGTNIQRYLRERKVPRPYVPCRINFTMLAVERVSLRKKQGIMGGGGSKAAAVAIPGTAGGQTDNATGGGGSVADSEAESSVGGGASKGFPGLTIGQAGLSRLIARTIWFSPSACTNVWACTGGNYKRCYGELAEVELEKYKLRKMEGRHLSALDHLQMNAMLTCQYDIFLECAIRHSTVVASLNTMCAYIETTRSILTHNPISTINLMSLQRTLLLYIGLSLRLVMLSPDCVQLRGGCFLILDKVARLERLLLIMPEKLLLPDKTEFINLEVYESSRNNIASKVGATMDNEQGLRIKEFELRKALGSASVVEEACDMLGEILVCCHALLESLGNNIDRDLQTLDMRMKFKALSHASLKEQERRHPELAHAFIKLSNANNPNATFNNNNSNNGTASGSGGHTHEGEDGSHGHHSSDNKGYQLPMSAKMLFSTEDLSGIELEDLQQARKDWIAREQYEDDDTSAANSKIGGPRKFRPLLDVAQASAQYNSKSTKLTNLSEAAKDSFADKQSNLLNAPPIQQSTKSTTTTGGGGQGAQAAAAGFPFPPNTESPSGKGAAPARSGINMGAVTGVAKADMKFKRSLQANRDRKQQQ